jgi:23S rRNA pseudouridine1911/1915/1917 synthase
MSLKKVEILYEDKDVLVINKPVGLVVHGDGKTKEKTLVDWLLKKYPEIKNVGDPSELNEEARIKNPDSKFKIPNSIIPRPGIVHRLDRETSGVLIVAKNQKSFLALKQQFHDHTISKTYFAFVFGTPRQDRGVIDFPIGRNPKDFRQWSASRIARGELRPAVTKFVIRKTGKGFSYVEVWPKTGRTHQIRVHFKAINHPIVGDMLYGDKKEKALGFGRLALHASSIEFTLPSGKQMRIEAPFPDDFKNALKEMDKK